MGTTRNRLAVGDICIIEVDDVNSPTGLWWGKVDEFTWYDSQGGYGEVVAHITGPFQFVTSDWHALPNYGTGSTTPHLNYRVYAADPNTVELFRRIQNLKQAHRTETHDLRTRLDELRGVLKSMGVSKDTLVDVVKSALGNK